MHRRRSLLALVAAMLAAAAVALACAVAPLSARADDDTSDEDTSTPTAITSTGGELSSGSYVLEDDVTLTTNLTVPEGATVTIDLNGHTLKGTGMGSVITVSGTLTIDDSSSDGVGVITGGSNTAGGGVYVSSHAVLVLDGGSISRNTATSSTGGGGGVYVSSYGSFTMNGGSISENTANSGKSTNSVNGGGVKLESYATFTMAGGSISSNTAYRGGGVYCYSAGTTIEISGGEISGNETTNGGGGVYVSSSGSKLVISGGEISKNKTTVNGRGGGVFLGLGASLEMTGGEICSNTAVTYGGGVYTTGSKTTFTMKGGAICHNTSTNGGGGLCLLGGGTTGNVIYGGSITGNTCTESYGGGIYCNSGTTVTLYNVVITENTASILGGGIWACNTGSIEVYVTEGGAVYGNNALGSDGTKTSSEAGDDIASVSKNDESYVLSLASRILGGGTASWYEDGGIDISVSYTVGYADKEAQRYGDDTEEIDNPENTTGSYALKDVATGTALAVAEATTFITGNSALRGGGIGTNGSIVIGDSTAETTSVTVTKAWDDSDDADEIRPESVTVYLYNTVDGTAYLIDSAVLSADNDWTCTFDELPVDGDYSYSVEEEAPAGYEASYETTTAEDGTTTVAITNTHEYVTVDVTVSKVWDDGDDADELRPDSVTVELYADGEATGLTVVLSEENGWTATFSDLPAYSYDEDCTATEVTYTVEEVAVEGYSASLTGVSFSLGTLTVEITNTHEVTVPEDEDEDDEPVTVAISVEKEWVDDADAEGLRPDSVTVELYANGVATGQTVVLSEANSWCDAFTGLDAYDEDGEAIAYAIAEVDVPDGYEVTYSDFSGGIEEGGWSITVTNSLVEEAEEPEDEVTDEEETITEEESAEVPDTGDATSLTWAVSALAGLAAVAGALALRRRARR